jgi:tripartite-type tricarboxylate transporter receptor subunit TctC
MLLTRREAICGYGGGLALLAGLPAFGQAAYPSRTIKMIVPYPAGGTTDFLGHLVADQLKTRTWRQRCRRKQARSRYDARRGAGGKI